MAKLERKASDWLQFLINTEINGMGQLDAHKDVWGDEGRSDRAIRSEIANFKKSDNYYLLKDIAAKSTVNSLENKATEAVEAIFEAHTQLLKHGNNTIAEASNQKDKLSAMLAQRENLAMSGNAMAVIQSVTNMSRNKEIPEESTAKGRAVIMD